MDERTTEQKILEAAIECIEREGIEGTTIRKIAGIAGVNSAAINYYFRSKDHLIRRALDLSLGNAFDWEDFAASQQLPPAQRIKAIMEELVRGALRYPGITRAHFHPILSEGRYDIPAVRAINHLLEELEAELSEKGTGLSDTALRQAIVQIVGGTLIPAVFVPRMFRDFSGIDFSEPDSISGYIESLADNLLGNPQGVQSGQLVVREADPSGEMEEMRALFREYAAELGEDLTFQGFHEELQELPGEYAPPGGSLYLAFFGGNPAGCVAMRRINDSTCEMKRLFVRPQYRRQKVGEALVRTIIASARTRGYGVMKLDSLIRLKAAYQLYRRFGFRETNPYIYNPLPGAVYMEVDL
jgi:AcrR family transcriptional regulator